MTRHCRFAVMAAAVLWAVLACAPALAAEVTIWSLDANRVLSVEVQDQGRVVKSEKIPLTSDGDPRYIVYLPSGTRFTLPQGWTVEVHPSAAQGVGSAGTPVGSASVRFTAGDTVLFSSSNREIPLTARFSEPASAPPMPFIQRQPRHQSVWVGETAAFDVEVTGRAPFFYQWQYYDRGVWRDIIGADEPALRVWRAQISDSGSRYRVIVTNAGGSVASSPAYLAVSYRGYDDDPWDGGFGYGYGTGCSAGAFAPLALVGLLVWRRRKSGDKDH